MLTQCLEIKARGCCRHVFLVLYNKVVPIYDTPCPYCTCPKIPSLTRCSSHVDATGGQTINGALAFIVRFRIEYTRLILFIIRFKLAIGPVRFGTQISSGFGFRSACFAL